MTEDPLAHLARQLEELEQEGLRRRSSIGPPRDELSFCSNDYLGLAARAAPLADAGAGASRLIAGERPEHRTLEQAFAEWLGLEDTLLFTSGYAANVGALAALAGSGDLLVSDALNHASIIDGARLSRARVVVVPHGDAAAIGRTLAERTESHAWVVVESYYSMDADSPDLGRLRELCDRHHAALYVDEAHALGVLGPGGRGLCADVGVVPDVLVGTLGKAFGGQGAFVGGRALVRDWLWNRARSFVFSTGLAPVSAAAGAGALRDVLDHPDRSVHVLAMAERLRRGLRATGAVPVATPDGAHALGLLGFGHIVPVVVGSATRAVALAERLRADGIAVHAIRPPTVPSGTARLRFTLTARHSVEDVDRAVKAFAGAVAALPT